MLVLVQSFILYRLVPERGHRAAGALSHLTLGEGRPHPQQFQTVSINEIVF